MCDVNVTLNDFANSDKAGNSEGFRKKIGFKTLIEEGETQKEEEEEQLQPATVYPLDMWFIIGEYIHPEDVGRFAAICSSTRAVVASPDFWLRLRRRYISGGRRESEKNNYALRAQVIRALRQSYPPLVVRPQFYLRSSTVGIINWWSTIGQRRILRFTGDHHLVLGACCIQLWQEKRKGSLVFYVKLKHPNRTGDVCNASNPEPTESLKCQDEGTPDCWMSRSMGEEILGTEHYDKGKIGDIWFNPEEGCKIIEVMLDKEHLTNGHFGPCPQILGLSLMWACARQSSTTTASSNSRRLDLLFGPPHLTPKAASSLLPKQCVGWKSCGGGWAEPVSEAEEIALSCGTPLPKGAKCGVNRQSCCRGGSAGIVKGLAYPEGIVPVHLPGVQSVRLLDWWDADYPYPGEVKNTE
ncbi:hypothetical protein J437_LFUL010865 [Ladona fulva]|uniref:F-box protein n=1 Tax=Ladona fulva TaxID=123851 RepID=A0A8K0K8B1_LADFU|nr:hypothetical protein J437_LFUL010865 [Ladona fulva]